MDIELKNGVYHFSGRLDEFAEFDSLVAGPDPLKVNLGKIQSINSIGIIKFLAFTHARGPKKFEFYDCTADFIANVNVIPQMLGSPSDARQIKTVYVPFSCGSCKRVENSLHELSKLKIEADGDVVIGSRVCSKCGNEMDLEVEKSEFFFFLNYLPKKS